MQKIKKALKKLAFSNSPTKSNGSAKSAAAGQKARPAQAAKKASPVKKKTQALPAKKAAPKTAKKAVAVVKKAIAKAVPVVKAKPVVPAKAKDAKKDVKDTKKKTAAPAPAAKAPVKAAPKAEAPKAVAKAAPVKPAAPVKAAQPKKVEAKSDAKSEAKAEAKPEVQEEAAVQAKTSDAQPKAAKAKKGREAEVVEAEPEEEVVLLDAEGRRYCRVKDCDQASTVDGYCRFHYLLFWKNIQNRKSILAEGKLERYIEELTARYPDKYLEMLKKDLRSEKEFMAAIQELEIDEAAVDNDYEDEAQNYLDEVRGMGTETGGSERDDEF